MLEAIGPRADCGVDAGTGGDGRARFIGLRICLVLVALSTGVGCQSLPYVEPDANQNPRLAALERTDTDADAEGTVGVRQPESDERSAADPAGGERAPLGFPPLSELLDDAPDGSDDDGPTPRRSKSEPDIRSPGPDTSTFPTGPYTLPQGRLYIETSPVFISGASQGSAKTYNAEFLIRYGLTDRVELRLFSNGPTYETGHFAASGMAPLAYDLKTNLWKENLEYHIPAVGLEVFVLTPSGSKGLNQGTEPSITLLIQHTLPFDVTLLWNVGMVGDPSPNNKFASIEPAAAWAFERELFDGFTFFLQGYFNGPTLPRYADGIELGLGVEWKLSKRLAIWSSYNLGVSPDAPTDIFYLGGAIAF